MLRVLTPHNGVLVGGSEGVEPRHQVSIAFPSWWFGVSEGGVSLLQRLALRLQRGLGVVVGRVEMRVPEPASNHGDIDAGRHKMNRSRMPAIPDPE